MGIEQDAAKLDATIRSVAGVYNISVERYESEYEAIRENVICARDRLLTLDDEAEQAKSYAFPWTDLAHRMAR